MTLFALLTLKQFTINILAALLMGLAIGLERQLRQHTAGLRTNALVSLGAALFVSLSMLVDNESSSTRIAGQVVTGIGFLGGGVILREGFTVRGMNTAATLWCTAAVGTLAGSGYVSEATVGTVAILVLNVALRPLVHKLELHSKIAIEVETVYRLRVVCDTDHDGVIRTILMRHINSQPRMSLQGISIQEAGHDKQSTVVAEIFSAERNDKYMNELVSRASLEPGVTSVSWERVQ
jgi:putative Mg2+ transporter-C (MgtC) family protein